MKITLKFLKLIVLTIVMISAIVMVSLSNHDIAQARVLYDGTPASETTTTTNTDQLILDFDDSKTTGTIDLQFGSTLGKKLQFDIDAGKFKFNDNLDVTGDISVTGKMDGVDLSQSIEERLGTGLISGGTIDKLGGFQYTVNAGVGYIGKDRIAWSAFTNQTAPANQHSHIAIDSSGSLVVSESMLDENLYILLGEITTNATQILHQHEITNNISKTPLNIINFVKDTYSGNIVASGLAVTENIGTPKTLSIDSGTYYHNGINKAQISSIDTSGSDVFAYIYRSADPENPNLTNASIIDVNNFDNGSGTLAAMIAGKWKKDVVVADASDRIYVIYGQQQFDNRDNALNGPLPAMPTTLNKDGVRLAVLLIEKGTASIGSNNIIDVRPGIGITTTGGTFSSHSSLSDLGADDHMQYAKEAETETISGAWTFATNPALPGTTSDSFIVDSDNSTTTPKLSFGSALTKFLEFDTSNDWFNLTRRLNIAGQGGVNGTKLTTRAGADDNNTAQLEIRDSANSAVFSVDEDGDVVPSGTVDGRDISTDGTTLDNHAGASSGVHGVTGSVVGTSDNQTLTTKTIDAASNTISNIGSTEIKNDSIVNADINSAAAISADKLADGVTNAIVTAAQKAQIHAQNTDTGSTQTSLTLDSDNVGAGADIDVIANQGSDSDGTLRYNATTNKWQISNDSGAFADITTGAAHSQNTDTGTTQDSFKVDSDDSATSIKLSFGSAVSKYLEFDVSNDFFNLTRRLNIAGQGGVNGTKLTTRAGAGDSDTAQFEIRNSANNPVFSVDEDGDVTTSGTVDGVDVSTHTGASSSVHGVTGSVVGTTDTQALTGKTINAANNTISNIGSTEITNDSIVNTDINSAASISADKLADGVTNAIVTAAQKAQIHAQNTDTGTTQDSFKVDSDDSATSIKLSFGSAVSKYLEFDVSNDFFNLTRRLNIAGQGGVDGIKLTTRAGAGDSDTAQFEIRNSANASVFSVDEDGDVTTAGTVDGVDVSTHAGASSGIHGVTGAVVGASDNQTLTTKTINAANNTISNIGSTEITNDSIVNTDINSAASISADKLADGVTNAIVTAAQKAQIHAQNTDTGSSQDGFIVDTDNSSLTPKLSFGSALTKFLEFDTANDWFNLSRRLNIAGQGGVNGIKLTTRAGAGDSGQAQIEVRNSANASVFSVDEAGNATTFGNINMSSGKTVDSRDISADGSTLDSHTAATTAHGATGAVVGTTNTQTLTGKTISVLNNTTLTLDDDNVGAGVDIDVIANQGSDLDGTLRYNATTNTWQISNNGGAFTNIPTTSGGGTLDYAYDFGGAGAGRTITVDTAPVKLDASGGTDAPLELTPQASAPSSNLSGGQLTVIGDLLYIYDSTRSKWVSPARTSAIFSKASGDGEYLNIGNALASVSGYVIQRNATIVGIGVSIGGGNNTKAFHVRKNGVADNLATFTLASANSGYSATTNVDVNAGDIIQLYVDATGAASTDSIVVLYLAWRP